MIKSMTGYGKGTANAEIGEVSIELKTVNHRFRDISTRLPMGLSTFETVIKKEMETTISRGKIDAFIGFETAQDVKSFEVNLPIARGYYDALTKLQKEFSLKADISVSQMTSIRDVIKAKDLEIDQDKLKELILTALRQALISLDDMRKTEGNALESDIKNRLLLIRNICKEVETKQPELARSYMEKLKNRIRELTEDTNLDEAIEL